MTNSLNMAAAALATPQGRDISMQLRQLSLAALLLGGVAAAHAGGVGVGVFASAIDTPDGYASVQQSDSANPLDSLVASATAKASAGSSFSQADASVDGLAGAMHMSLSAATSNPPTGMQPGRDGLAQGSMDMSGSITLSSGGLPSGSATFTAALDGLYNGGPADTGFGNVISGTYAYSVSIDNVRYQDVGGPIYFGPGAGGSFVIPMSITLPVFGGDVVYFDLGLYDMYVETVAGSVSFDASNTFKITGIDLPTGYTYTSDSSGFLSQFPAAAVPEPATSSLALAGLLGVVGATVRRRRGTASNGA